MELAMMKIQILPHFILKRLKIIKSFALKYFQYEIKYMLYCVTLIYLKQSNFEFIIQTSKNIWISNLWTFETTVTSHYED